MSGIFETVQLLIKVGGFLMFGFMVLLAMPQSKLRDMVMPFVGWAVAALSAAYCVLPFDAVPEALLGPFGLIDDLFAGLLAIFSGFAAWLASKRLGVRLQLEADEAAKAAAAASNSPGEVVEIEACDVEVIEA